MKKLIRDDYPRGQIHTHKGEISASRIDLAAQYVIFIDLKLDATVLLPFTQINHIVYENVPQEIIDRREQHAKQVETATSN